MVVKLLFIVLASVAVFWLIGRFWPRVQATMRGRILPLLLSPLALPLLRRGLMLLVRLLLFRR